MTERKIVVEKTITIDRCEGGIWFVGEEMCATAISAGEKIAALLGLNGEIKGASPAKKRGGRKPGSKNRTKTLATEVLEDMRR